MENFFATIVDHLDTMTAVIQEDREGVEATMGDSPETLTATMEDC